MTATIPAPPWPADTRYLRVDDLTVDLRYRHLRHGHRDIELPQRVFDLLLLLLAEPHALHTRASLFERLWPGSVVEDANLTQSIWLLRRALGNHKDWVHTVAKGGYVFEPPVPVEWSADPGDGAGPPGRHRTSPTATAAAAGGAKAASAALVPEAVPGEAALPAAALAGDARALQASGSPGYWKSSLALAALLGLIAVAGFWLRDDPRRIEPARIPPPPLTVALILVEDSGAPAQWPAKLLHGWMNWKLASLPEVTVLNEAELAAGMGSTPAQVVFLASGDAPDASGKLLLRARFQQAGREQQVEQTGTAAQMPALVDAMSVQVMQRLLPDRSGPWPRLEVDAPAARRYADATEAMERRDWMAAAAIGEEVVKLAPRFGLARLQLAQAQARLAQAAQAVEHMDAARELLQPAPPEVTELLDAQRLAVNPQQYQQAAEAYGKLATRYPDKMDYAIDYAGLLVGIGRPQQALTLMQAHGKQGPIGTRISRLLTLAQIYQALGDPERMRRSARAAERLARDAGAGWELESGTALLMVAGADSIQVGPRAGNAMYEQAARQFEKAGNGTAALYARFLAEVSGPPDSDLGPRLDALLAQANAGGYRELEINILFHLANQLQMAGDLPGYRRRLEEAAGIAQSAGDSMALTKLDMLLLVEDLMTARLASAGQRVQRLRSAGLEGELALLVEELDATVAMVRGNRAQALQTLARARRALPTIQPGEPLSEAQLHLYCMEAEARMLVGELAAARADIQRCAASGDPSTQLLAIVHRATADQLAGDRQAARRGLRRVEVLLPEQGAGPDRWLLTIEVARLLTRLGDTAASDTLYQSLPAALRSTGYALLTALLDTGLAENAAARGDWAASERLAAVARKGLPADTWIVHSRLDLLAAAAAVAAGDRARTGAIAGKLHAQAHRLGDAVVQMELHSLLPVGAFEEDSPAHREAITARTGMRGATVEWINVGTIRNVLETADNGL